MHPVDRAAAHVHRAVDGHHTLVDRITTWVAAEAAGAVERRRAIATRSGILAGGALLGWQLGPGGLAVATPAWLAAAWWHGPAATEATDEPKPEAPPLDPAAARHRDLTAIRRAIGDRRGIHLAEITTRLQAAGVPWDTADVRAWITGHGVPIRPKLRVGGKAGRVNAGVHVDDLEAALNPAPQPDPDPSPAGVAAGHDALHPPLHAELHPTRQQCYTLDEEPEWPGSAAT
ncbi:hypothetical protein [Embleya sp. NPDC020630]|uniref:hypothetical protein n=1 Tax=Embleya sp. NPDC020630 TaxID=3363979 RepID=UPI00379C39A8